MEEIKKNKDDTDDGSKKLGKVVVSDNHIYFYAGVSRDKVLQLNKEIKELSSLLYYQSLEEEREPSHIKLHIHSNGGSILPAFAAINAITTAKVPVDTIVDGYAASAATLLSVVGKRRYITKYGYIMIHQLSAWMDGKLSEIRDTLENAEELMSKIKKIYTEYTKIPEKDLDNILENDLYFDAEKCLKYGLVDKVLK